MLTAKMKSWLPDWRIVPAAVCYCFAFPPYDFPFLIFPAFGFWFASLHRRKNWKEAALDGLWMSQIIAWISFTWVAYAVRQFGGLPMPLAYVVLVLFGLVCQPQFWLFTPLWFFLRKQFPRYAGAAGFLIPLAYAAFDYGLPKLFADTAGHAYYARPWLRQAADLGGAALLTFFTVALSLFFWRALEDSIASKAPAQRAVLSWGRSNRVWVGWIVVMSAGWVGYGIWRVEDIRNKMDSAADHLQLAVIQANIGDFDKIASERGIGGAANEILRQYFELSDEAMTLSPRPDALIWPETAYPSTFRTPSTSSETKRDEQMAEFVRTRNVSLLFGGYDHQGGKDFNAFFFLAPPAAPSDLQTYQKNLLLWFGEYMPLSEYFDWLKRQFPQVGNFGRGRGPSVLTVRGVPVSPIICYEALFASYTLPAVIEGSRLIINVTNDSWFGPWGEPQLHFALTVFRGIEARVPQLRATNTGISALILTDGSVEQQTALFKPEILNVRIPIHEPIPTLMKRWGDWFAPFAALVVALSLMGSFVWRGSVRRRKLPKL